MNNIEIDFNNNYEQINILRGTKVNPIKENNSSKLTDEFFKAFIQTFVLSKWKYQITARKYRKRNNRKPTKNDIFLTNTKKLFNSTANIFADHKANYLYDLFDLMEQMPYKPGIEHDKDYGTIKIINNKTLDIKSMKRIKFLAKLYFIIRINSDLENVLIESINKMKESKKKKN